MWAQGTSNDKYPPGFEDSTRVFGCAGSLRNFDAADIVMPIEEVRAYLSACYGVRFDLHPRVLEETVASVFRDLGFHARLTSYSNDGGIDVILDGPKNVTIGVQVKRWRNQVKVEQIRALTGALLLQGHTAGVFITTSNFQSGAYQTASLSAERGIPIALLDAERFYDALKIAQHTSYVSSDVIDIPFLNAPMRLLEFRGCAVSDVVNAPDDLELESFAETDH